LFNRLEVTQWNYKNWRGTLLLQQISNGMTFFFHNVHLNLANTKISDNLYDYDFKHNKQENLIISSFTTVCTLLCVAHN